MVVGLLLGGCAPTTVRYTQEEIQEFPPPVQSLIMKGEVALGMTPKQVRYAWGGPDSVRILEPLDGKAREEWTYTKLGGVYQTRKLLFVNGKLIYMLPEPERAVELETGKEPEKAGTTERPVEKEKIDEPIKLQDR